MATISDVARLMCVSRDTVKHWLTEFAEHLSFLGRPTDVAKLIAILEGSVAVGRQK